MEPDSKRVSLTKPSHRAPEPASGWRDPSTGEIYPSGVPREVPRPTTGFRSGSPAGTTGSIPRPAETPAYSGTKFCSCCGQALAATAVVCPCCGSQTGDIRTVTPPPVVVNNYINTANVSANTGSAPSAPSAEPKNKWITFVLCLMFGYLGAHKFYEGKIGMGILYLFTGGLFYIGTIIDMIVALTRPTTYYP